MRRREAPRTYGIYRCMVMWIIGLSASGKTTIARRVVDLWRATTPNVVLVDGDDIRRIFRDDRTADAYTLEGRKRNANRIGELCAWLDQQGIHVVCSILSIFEESRDWNRVMYSKYFEVFIDVPMAVLEQREVKGIYASANRGEERNVVGVDIPFTPPARPDFVFDNRKDRSEFTDVAWEILTRAGALVPS